MTTSRKSYAEDDLDAKLNSYACQAKPVSGHTRRKELLTYSAAATAALSMGVNAEADVVYSGLTNQIFSVATSFTMGSPAFKFGSTNLSAPLDIDQDGSPDIIFDLRAGGFASKSFGFGSRSANISVGPAFSTATKVANLHSTLATFNKIGGGTSKTFAPINNLSGQTFGPAQSFKSGGLLRGETFANSGFGPGVNSRGLWNNSETRFLGVSFQRSNNTHYAWLQLHVNVVGNDTNIFPTASLTIIDYAWEDIPDQKILAGDIGGAIPEPGSLGLLAVGAAGILASRRIRRRREEEEQEKA